MRRSTSISLLPFRSLAGGAVALPFLLAGCSSLTSPPETEIEPQLAPVVTAAVAPAPLPAPAPAPPAPPEERASASHLLVAYQGARGADPKITRTKEQAQKRAEEALKKAKKGADFAALAKEYSDDPGSGPRGGDLGTFSRATMVKPFADATFSLKAGEISGIVETDFGFHVIKRTQ